MNEQKTLAMASEFERYGKQTCRERSPGQMNRVLPWPAPCALAEPHFPKAGSGRQPVGLERMLRIYFLQQWCGLSDPAVEEALYDSRAMRGFVGIDLGLEPVPDETTVCKFHHLLERNDLGRPAPQGFLGHLTGAQEAEAGGEAMTSASRRPVETAGTAENAKKRVSRSALENASRFPQFPQALRDDEKVNLVSTDSGQTHGATDPDGLLEFFRAQIDLTLFPQGFEEEHLELRRANFPSKLPEACQIGLPLLVVGPREGSPFRWAAENLDQAAFLDSTEPVRLATAIRRLAEPHAWEIQRQRVALLAATMFSPRALHEKFERSLRRAALGGVATRKADA